jgi:energy-coupling factor transporter ATP-binding protein EcfA2
MKFFNITGSIIPKKHYFAPTDDKIKQIFAMIEKGEYFVINKPRQFGKTTTIKFLKKFLNQTEDYLCVSISFEGISDEIWKNEDKIIYIILNRIIDTLNILKQNNLIDIIRKKINNIKYFDDLSRLITELVLTSNKELVLIIDEVDAAANHKMFISFLAMLRKKYLDAGDDEDKTFHSIILAGVHDIKNLKEQIRGEDESVKFNSPWNIAANFDVIMELKPFAIEKMLADYKSEAKVQLNEKVLAEKIYYWTSGYPFLVSALCKIMDEELLPKKSIKKLDLNDLNDAIQVLLSKKTTNFESLIKNIDNNPKIFNQVEKIILNGEKINFSTDNKIIESCIIYGIIRNEGEYCKIHNRIYEQRIYNYLLSKYQTDNGKTIASDIITSKYLDKKNDLILEKLLIDFQSIIKSKYASDDVLKSDEFLEKQVRLLFFVFLEPLLNNMGFAFKEVETSLEKRMDILIIYNNKKYIVELKLFYGQEYHKKGLEQLNDYLDRESINKGYIMIFNKKESKEFKSGWLKYKDKDIFELWF